MSADFFSLFNWNQILPALGLSALVSGVVSSIISTVVNYLVTMREFRKKNEIEIIKEKLDVCSFMIYHLDEMQYKYEAASSIKSEEEKKEKQETGYIFTNQEFKKYIQDIDEKIKNKYYLVNQKILQKWVITKTLRAYPQSKETMSELRKILVEEYNKTVDKLAKNLTGIIPKIS
jgi:MoaA/NifB/PqqE/SkfB family radical SAM enzyme